MAEQGKNGISWCDYTFNPHIGCTKVSPACKFCYAERDMDHRYGKAKWGNAGTRVVTSDENWFKPIRWNRAASGVGPHAAAASVERLSNRRKRVFCASLCDVFEDWIGPMFSHRGRPLMHCISCGDWSDLGSISSGCCRASMMPVTMDDVRARLFRLIDATPNLDWLLLTKRPENIQRMWVKGFCDNHVCEASKTTGIFCPHDSCDLDDGVRAAGRSNVWLGTSVENQEYAEKRIPHLLGCRDLARVLFLSCEPLLGPVDLSRWMSSAEEGKFWVIAGGESGPEARPSHPNWFRGLRDQCAAAGVPFHFKQLSQVDGKHFNDFNLFPDDLKVREFPNA